MQYRLMCLGGPQDGMKVCGTASHFASPDGSNYSLCNLRVTGQDVLSAPRKFWKWNELSLYHANELANQRYRSH